MYFTGALLVAYVFVFLAVVVAMVVVGWPRQGRAGLRESETMLSQVGYWSAAVLPPVGFILGIVVAASSEARHGLLVMGLAIIAVMVYVPIGLLFVAG